MTTKETFIENLFKEEKIESIKTVQKGVYINKRLEMLWEDIVDILTKKWVSTEFRSFSDKSWANLHLTKEGEIPESNKLHYDAIVEYAKDEGITLKYEISYIGDEALMEWVV